MTRTQANKITEAVTFVLSAGLELHEGVGEAINPQECERCKLARARLESAKEQLEQSLFEADAS